MNVVSDNTDERARNHAAFCNGQSDRLTPAYDICPQHRTGGEASRAMLAKGQQCDPRLTACLEATAAFSYDDQSLFNTSFLRLCPCLCPLPTPKRRFLRMIPYSKHKAPWLRPRLAIRTKVRLSEQPPNHRKLAQLRRVN
ncbi:hypothetical protein ThimaDRAFT_4520 [Thiocapsa marina 5811]|uniref:HipA-like C-terminal domain-containing protein n=1 Tax=Thiocapsa marina 5811 TaxID=768671 RepID=F9UHW7_9GAMM|nr:hypothetical protein ThimaDRAFT_4520 [Thiocapsa marina 5811]